MVKKVHNGANFGERMSYLVLNIANWVYFLHEDAKQANWKIWILRAV